MRKTDQKDKKAVSIGFNKIELKRIEQATQRLYEQERILKPSLYAFCKYSALSLADFVLDTEG